MKQSSINASLGAVLAALLPALSASAASFAFEFNNDGVLPSAQGAPYVGTVAESSAYSVSGGLLHQNTTQFGGGARASYELGAIFDPAFDFSLTWSTRILTSQFPIGTSVGFAGGGRQYEFGLINGGLTTFTGGSYQTVVPMDTTDALHTYRLLGTAASPSYQLFVDDVLRYTGTARSTAASFFQFGDATTTGGNGTADWDFVRFVNVPEPSAAFLGALGIGAVVILKAFKRRHA